MFSQPSRSIGGGVALVLLVTFHMMWAGHALADDATEAKAQYQKATAHFAVGEYREAAAAYEAAFKLKQDPALLYNAAQSHRLAGDKSKALLLYRNLVKLYPTSTYAVDSQQHVDKLEAEGTTVEAGGPQGNVSPPAAQTERQRQAAAPATQPAVSPLTEGAQASPAGVPILPAAMPGSPPAAPAPSPEPPALIATSAPAIPVAEPRTALYRRWWFWAAAGGVAVGAAVVGVIALSGGKAWATNPDVHGAP